ncbi:PIR protein [Plasmodium malariae]|uniref:PIR protein n=1 Tax=Plasmodium malariae TaxID=5858 RepID=A0A1D3PA74_PLAMA|nr:PIR protein [Plasmodium malariae]SCN11979.1 PIR protein [Plasmodium malariae]
MPSVLQENFIQALPSKIYYRQNFEKEFDYCFGSDEKRKFKEERSKLNIYEKINSIENRLVNALCHVAFTNEGDECKEKCRNLYYWLGNELLLNNIEENSFSDVIGILIKISNALYERGKCKCNFFTDVNKEKFEKMKIVYDYCKDHDNIENTLKEYNNICDSEFNAYLLKANSAYNEIYKCTETKFESYCMQLKTHVSSCFEKKLLPLTCKIEEVSPEDRVSSRYGTTYIDPEHVINVSAFSSSQIFLFFVLPFVGIFFIGFLLYKFTPIVPWIHTKVLKKKSIRRNFDEMDILELTEYTNEQRKSNLGRKQLNVAYHAA